MAKTMTTTTTKKKKDEPEDWRNSKAKKLLRMDILSGKVTASMDALLEVKKMRPEFAPYRDDRFADNFSNLCKAIECNKARMSQDIIAYGHDLGVMKRERQKEPLQRLPWHRTECPALLKADIDAGKYPAMTPKELYTTRNEYQAFTLAEFRMHIHQERADREKKKSRPEKKKLRAAERKEFRAILHGE